MPENESNNQRAVDFTRGLDALGVNQYYLKEGGYPDIFLKNSEWAEPTDNGFKLYGRNFIYV